MHIGANLVLRSLAPVVVALASLGAAAQQQDAVPFPPPPSPSSPSSAALVCAARARFATPYIQPVIPSLTTLA